MTIKNESLEEVINNGRRIAIAEKDDEKLGPLGWLPGKWVNTDELNGYGFNMMALPFGGLGVGENPNGYRLLMNQYNEELNFSIADLGVPNRGTEGAPDGSQINQLDQTVVALDYRQVIRQITSDDSFLLKGNPDGSREMSKSHLSDKFDDKAIHHEPGLWLYMTDRVDMVDEFADSSNKPKLLNIARMGNVPHGNSFMAIGFSEDIEWENLTPDERGQRDPIPNINGVVVGGGTNPDLKDALGSGYFSPYKHFHDNPFVGNGKISGFRGLDPVDTTSLLRHAQKNILEKIGKIKRIRVLHVDSTIDHAGMHSSTHSGIVSTPFITRQADTTAMVATFIVYEVEDAKTGKMRYFLQYAQNVILDFINRPDGHPGRARWPHVSINTLERVADAYPEAVTESLLAV